MKWLDALKAWNEQHGGRWTIPKKGSPEYDAVKALQGASTPAHPTRSESPQPDSETERIVDEVVAVPKKVRKSRAKKVQTDDADYE
jgi:hypothetical protein